ncbi:Unannotated [Lentimonas sp. CC4]|nr:Unannotated [Lentimonas sp. CC4]CAA6687030.1 Unannotated [Lentimonas sp. CC6]CAA7076197.1 Unannotated [Lentimonas sp. CC4]CAA7171155.1 Unannotated [Lentimonas sp. CC21]CAA7182736.1 Unannotated [Lentimonas sp. CC8]
MFSALKGETALKMVRYDTTTEKGKKHYAEVMNLILTDSFKTKVQGRVEKELKGNLDLAAIESVKVCFLPYESIITIEERGDFRGLIESNFADEIVNFNLTSTIDRTMKEVEAQRAILDSLKIKLEDDSLSDSEKAQLNTEFEIEITKLFKIKSEVMLDGEPQWRIEKPTSR